MHVLFRLLSKVFYGFLVFLCGFSICFKDF